MRTLARYELLADLFEYPDQDFPRKVIAVRDYLDSSYPGAAGEVEKFLAFLPAEDVVAMQELFTRSFDVQAATTLDIGYVLFGDDYKRGEMLSNLNREHRLVGHDCGTELSDHLPNLLHILNRIQDQEVLNELVSEVIAPSLDMMMAEFSKDRLEKRKKSFQKHYKTVIEMPKAKGADQLNASTAYRFVLNALAMVLKEDFQYGDIKKPQFDSDFLASINLENEIEDQTSKLY